MMRLLAKFCVLLLLSLPLTLALPAYGQQVPAPAPGPPSKLAKPDSVSNRTGGAKPASSYKEDYSVLPLEGNHLKLELAVLGEKDEKPGMPFTRERWHLLWRPGDPIDVYIVKPKGVEKPPVVLYLYSWPQDTDRFKEDYWCGATTGSGVAAVGFVSALTGHRLEYRHAPKEDFFTQLPESMGATVHDVQMILNFLDSRREFDMSRVGMLGQGSGGAIAILASAVDPRIKALDVLTPWGDWPVFLAKSTFVVKEERADLNKPEFLKTVAGLDPQQWFPKVKARSIRLQNVRKDGHMPDEAQEGMEAAAPETAEIDQFGDLGALYPAAANGLLLNWITTQLKPGANPPVFADKAQRVHYFPPKTPANPLGGKP